MLNRLPFNSYQSMNLVHRTKQGKELWLGDYSAATNTALLKKHKIQSVLTSAAMLNVKYPPGMQINHKTISAYDIPTYKMMPHFQQAFQFINDALTTGNILVHCAAGISRSTTFVLVYLMKGEGMKFTQALQYVRNKRAIVCPNYGFQGELKRYDNLLKNTNKKTNQANLTQKTQQMQKNTMKNYLNQQNQLMIQGQKNLYLTASSKLITNSRGFSLDPINSKKQSQKSTIRERPVTFSNFSKLSKNKIIKNSQNRDSVSEVMKRFKELKVANPLSILPK